jgi:uncharacterized protein YbaR (Trm112 family)
MKSMKDYVDEIMKEVFEMPKGIEHEPNYQKGLEMACCPFCNGVDLIIYFRETAIGQNAYHKCPSCKKAWLIEFDYTNDSYAASEIEWSVDLPDVAG